MNDADPRPSKILLLSTALGAGLSLAGSIHTRGLRRSLALLVLGAGPPMVGEVLATGPLRLLRHRTRPRVAGVPVAVVLGWYCAVHGSLALAERVLARSSVGEATKRWTLPPLAALVGTSLDLILDPAGLDAGLWEWRVDGFYAKEIEGANGRRGVPLVNFLGWLALVGGAALVYGLAYEEGKTREVGRLPALLLVPPYLAAVLWAVRAGRPSYLLHSAPFPLALYAGLKNG